VLGAAGRDERTARALGAHLGDGDPSVRRFVLDALAAQGSAAESVLRGAVAHADRETRHRAASLLGKIASRSAVAALVRALADDDLADEALAALRAAIDAGKAKAAVVAETKAQLSQKSNKGSESQRSHLLRLVGYLADPASLPLLSRSARAGEPSLVRAGAIAAMRRVLPAAKKTDEVVAQLLAFADDADLLVAHAAVDTLRGAPIPAALGPKLAALSHGRHPEARRLAMERLPAVGQKSAIPELIAALVGNDPAARDAAGKSLAQAPDAPGPLAEALAAARDPESARRLAQALRHHETQVAPRVVDKLASAADGPTGAVVLEALARLDPERHAQIRLRRVDKLSKQGQLADAYAAARPLLGAGIKLAAEDRLRLAALGVRARGKDLLRAARSVDPVLVTLQELAREGFPLVRALRKQVGPDELFVLGFNFMESGDEDDRELGTEFLEAVIEAQPRGKLGLAAKNKLELGHKLR
jgi:HEAT repeat protein